MRPLITSALAIGLFGASCSVPQIKDLPVKMQFKSKHYYKEIIQCQGILDLIKSRNLILSDYTKDSIGGTTFVNHEGSERLLVALKYYGTSVTFKSENDLPPFIKNAAEDCGI